MIDETDISSERSFYEKQRALKVIESLKKRSMNGYYASNRAEALSIAMGLIPPEVVVARGTPSALSKLGF